MEPTNSPSSLKMLPLSSTIMPSSSTTLALLNLRFGRRHGPRPAPPRPFPPRPSPPRPLSERGSMVLSRYMASEIWRYPFSEGQSSAMWPKPRQFQQLRSLDILARSIWGPPRPPLEAMSAWSSSPATLASARAVRSWAVSCLGFGRMSPERKWLRHKSSKKLMQDWKSRPLFCWLMNCRAAP